MESTYQSQENKEIARALFNVQRKLSFVPRDAKNSFTNSTYATLKSVMDTCRDVLAENGIWLCQYPVPVDTANSIGLVTKLTHVESGQWQSSLAVVPLPKADPQGMGSAITYARRYALTAMLGMITEDDDGEAAKAAPKSAARSRRPVSAPQTQKGASVERTQGDASKRGSNRHVEALEKLPRLDGITYQVVSAQDGRECIIATGNTLPRKEILAGAGFRWNADRKLWWKYADAV